MSSEQLVEVVDDSVARFVSQTQECNPDDIEEDDDLSNEWTPSKFDDAEEEEPVSKMPRLQERKNNKNWWCLFIDEKGLPYFPAEGHPENVNEALWVLAGREFGGTIPSRPI